MRPFTVSDTETAFNAGHSDKNSLEILEFNGDRIKVVCADIPLLPELDQACSGLISNPLAG